MSRTVCTSLFVLVSAGFGPCALGRDSSDRARLPDPTRPPAVTTVNKAPPKVVGRHGVSSIIFSAQRRVAVVNGKVITEGDLIDGARVLKIGEGQVWLELADNSRRTLSLDEAAETRVTKSSRQKIVDTAVAQGASETVMDE